MYNRTTKNPRPFLDTHSARYLHGYDVYNIWNYINIYLRKKIYMNIFKLMIEIIIEQKLSIILESELRISKNSIISS
jgi:hypothetical protein